MEDTSPRPDSELAPPKMATGAKRVFLLTVGFVSLGLGIIGVVLPVLPTTPFVLLSVACFGRSSERWHRWLTEHPVLGPPIRDWNRHGVIRTRAKIIATTMILSLGIPTMLLVPLIGVSIFLGVTFTCVLTFIWTRPGELPAPSEAQVQRASAPQSEAVAEKEPEWRALGKELPESAPKPKGVEI